MLTILGKKHSLCDGITRRSFLKIGGLAMGAAGGIGLPALLKAQSENGNKSSHKAIINIFLSGGPPHQDMWDIKTDAPSEVRGPFEAISTAVPGIQIGECFPKIAAMMDKMAVIRSVVGSVGHHDGYQCMSGWNRRDKLSIGGCPSIGSVLAKLKGPVDPGIPPHVGLSQKMGHIEWAESGSPGFLGATYKPFKPDGQGMSDLKLNNMTLDRLSDRKTLQKNFDRLRSDIDSSGMMKGMDSFTQAAFDVLSSNKLMDALDISKESQETRDRYGDGKPYKYQYDGAPTVNDQILMARRLVEAGARSVSLSYGRWDSHGDNFGLVRHHGPRLDQAVSALVQDLEERGMLDDVTVVVWGEFGRTPMINKNSGRDHWPRVSCALLAGGGMKVGQVIGSTNRLGEAAATRPVHMQEIIATLYHNLGIDPLNTTLIDNAGRPQYLIERRNVVHELV